MSEDDAALFIIGGVVGAAVGAAILRALSDRESAPSNRYQVGVAAGTAASVAAEGLEALVTEGYVDASGDPANPNERRYVLHGATRGR